MRIGVLGTVEVWADCAQNGSEAALRGSRLRGLLARLALEPDRPVTVEALIDALWGEQPPDAAGNALQALVSRLRRALGADLVTTVPGGYRLRIAPDEVDASRFAALRAAAATQADPAIGHTLLADALELWRGPALADVRELPFAGPAADALAEQRAATVDERRGWPCASGSQPSCSTRCARNSPRPHSGKPPPRCWPAGCTPPAAVPTRWRCWTAPDRCSPRSSALTPATSWSPRS